MSLDSQLDQHNTAPRPNNSSGSGAATAIVRNRLTQHAAAAPRDVAAILKYWLTPQLREGESLVDR